MMDTDWISCKARSAATTELMATERLVTFVKERQAIYERRMAGEPKPWTKNKILQQFRFSNMLRENDTVTKWIADNWRDRFSDHPDLWFAIVVARLINEPMTLAEIGFPVITPTAWERMHFEAVVRARKSAGLRTWNPAYMIPACNTKLPKVELNLQVLDSLWASRATLRPRPGDTLRSYQVMLGQMWGIGSFLTAQIIADLKYVEPLMNAADWYTFAASGPGSRRGLCRVQGKPVSKWRELSEDRWWHELIRLRDTIMPCLKDTALYGAHAQDVQNWLCEFDKFERARLGEGRPKQTYKGGA
jgi:alpha-glutamyl/putrescinyl thymine pyrophosphorylase clade 1